MGALKDSLKDLKTLDEKRDRQQRRLSRTVGERNALVQLILQRIAARLSTERLPQQVTIDGVLYRLSSDNIEVVTEDTSVPNLRDDDADPEE